MKFFATLVVALMCVAVVRGQNPSPRLQFGAAWETVSDRGSVQTVDPTNECNTFANGTGSGFAASAGIDWRLAPAIRFGGLLAAHAESATFVTRQSNALVRDAQNNLVPFVRDYTMAVNLTRIAAVGTATYQPFSFPLEIGAGIGPDIRIASPAARTGAVVSPTNVQFAGHLSTEDLGSAALPGLRALGALATASLAYSLPLARTMHLVPEARVTYEIPSIASGGSWTPLAFTLGVSVAADLHPEPAPPEEAALEPVVVETIITTTPGAAASGDAQASAMSVSAYTINATGTNESPARILCERVAARVTELTRDGEHSIDTTLVIPRPRSIVFVLTGPPQPPSSMWNVRVTAARDTLFTRSANAAPPAAIVWREEEIRDAVDGDEATVSATAATREGGQSAVMIPVVVGPARDTARVHRYALATDVLESQWSALMSRFAAEAGRTGSITITAQDRTASRRARLHLAAAKAREQTQRDTFERKINEFGEGVFIDITQ